MSDASPDMPRAASDRLEALLRMLEADPADAFCLYGAAQEYAKRGDVVKAVEFFDRAIAADGTNAYAHFHKASVLHESGQVAAAIDTVREGLTAARTARDGKAESELTALLEEWDDAA